MKVGINYSSLLYLSSSSCGQNHVEIPQILNSKSISNETNTSPACLLFSKKLKTSESFDVNSISIIKRLKNKKKKHKHKLENNSIQAELEIPSNKQDYKDIVTLREMSIYEKINLYEDKWSFLDLRKAILTIKASISELCLKLITSFYFEIFILIVILMNIVTLGLNGSSSTLSSPMESLELFYLIVYTIEASIKILAYGFAFSRGSYMRDLWNYIDITIVISGWVDITMNSRGVKLTSLRTLRILRPLRGITFIKGLRVIVRALINSAKHLAASISLLLIFLLIFAIAGLQIWSGSMKWKCLNIQTGIYSIENCGGSICDEGYECVYSLDNPNNGATNFDNLLYSFLTVFQCITLEGWTDTMLYVTKAYNMSAIIFFVILVFIGAYLLISLTLVVIKSSLTNSIKAANSKSELDLEDELDTNTLAEHFKKLLTGHSDVQETSRSGNFSESDFQRSPSEVQRDIENREDFEVNYEESEYIRVHSDGSQLNEPGFEDRMLTKKLNHVSPTAESGDLAGIKGYKKPGLIKVVDFNLSGKGKRLNNLQTLTPMLSRMNSSIKVSKKLIAKLKSEAELIPMIHYTKIKASSADDVQPEDVLEKYVKSGIKYEFYYRKKGEKDYVQALLDHENRASEYFCEHCKEIGSNQKIVRYYSDIHSAKKIFFRMKVNVKNFISKVKSLDLVTLKIVGDQSQVIEEKLCEALYTSLNHMNYIIWKKGPDGVWAKLIWPLQKLTFSKYFSYFIYFCILANTIVLSIDHYGISASFLSILNTLNTIFTFIFGAELALKILAVGIKKFTRDLMNYLDLLIVVSSFIEFGLLSGSKSALSAFRAIRIFKLIRVIRVARLFRYLKSMSHIILVISRSISKLAYVAILLFIFVIIYSLLGMEIFAGNLDFPRQSRGRFDNFYWAFLSIFQVLSIENWQSLLYDTMSSSKGPASAFFLVSWVLLGNFILLNLFLAIVLDAFTSEETEEEPVQVDSGLSRTMTNALVRRRSSIFGSFDDQLQKKREQTLKMIAALPDVNSESDISLPSYLKDIHRFDKIACERSYFIFEKSSKIRILCNKITNSSKFEFIILIIIAVSSIKIVLETYAISSPTFPIIMSYLDLSLTLCFIVEYIIKSINSGFIYDKGAYLNDRWNIIDFSIIILSIIDLLLSSVSLHYIKIFRLIRTFRALRFISHNVSMKIVVKALLQSIVAIVNVVLVCMIVWIMFAIFGVSLFGGKLYKCSNILMKSMDECLENGYSWNSEFPNYDNVINAMVTLFIVSSEEGWPDIMYTAIDATDIGLSPVRDYNPLAGLYFVSFIFVGGFFFMNLFIGVVFEQFNEANKNESSLAAIILNKDQMLWVELQNLIVKSSPKIEFSEPTTKVRKFCYLMTRSWYFETFIMVCILLNMCSMAVIYDGASNEYTFAIDISNLCFTTIFIIEALFKLIGNGMHYFKSSWNKFDFLVAASSCIDIVLTYAASSSITLLRSGPQLLRIIKLFRISRLFRLFRSLKPLQTLLTILKYSLPAILNVLSLMLLIFFIYAVVGVYLFSDITQGEVINNYNNFSNFGMAMLLLFRSATGENWYIAMHDCARNLGTGSSYVYFCSFITISSFIMLNLFIMVILQNYDDYQSNPYSVFKIFNKDIKRFKNAWGLYSKGDELRVHYKYLPDIMYELGAKFGVSKELPRDKVLKYLSIMNLHIEHEGFVHYNDFLFAVMKRKYAERLFRRADPHTSKIVAKENANTLKKLKKMRKKYYEDKAVQSIRKSDKNMNFFIGMIYIRTIFKTWKHWAHTRKIRKIDDKSFDSITPRLTEVDFPGINTENAPFITNEMNREESESSSNDESDD